MKEVAVVLSLLAASSASSAGPLLESNKRRAATVSAVAVVQPVGCSRVTAAGQNLADSRENMAG